MISGRFAPVLRELQPLTDRFAAAGHRLFLVGGTVRDVLFQELGDDIQIDTFDIDATTTARPEEIKRCLHGWADAVWTQGERFGTIGAMKRHAAGVERIYEITTHRAEAYQAASRHPDVEFSLDIEADLSRRDFTINAMALELTAHAGGGEPVLVDPFAGRDDLARRLLRTPLAPNFSFSDDPLRMLRAARFVARYQLHPDPAVTAAVAAMGARITIVSAERTRDELGKLLAVPLPGIGLHFVSDTGLMRHVIPELAVIAAHPDDHGCHQHLLAHTIAVIDAIQPPHRLARSAALLRPLGPRVAAEVLRRLRSSNDERRDVLALIEWADGLSAQLMSAAPWGDGDVRRHVRDTGHLSDVVHSLVAADASVRPPIAAPLAERLAVLRSRIEALAAVERLDDLRPQLDGAEVMAVLGTGPGRHVGEAIRFLSEVRLDEGVLEPAVVRDRLKHWWRDRQQPVTS